MRKDLIAALVTLGLGAAATAVIVGTSASAQAPTSHNPVLLAQATPPVLNAAPAAPRGRRSPAPTATQQSARRAAFCQETYARAAGRFAYLEARLNLTEAQTSAFVRWRDLRLVAAKRQAVDCAARPMPQGGRGARGATAARPSPVERLAREETTLQRRLGDIQAERPALDALYGSLTPTQRQVLVQTRGGFAGRGPRGRMGFGRGSGRNGNMMFRRGPTGGPMNGGMNGAMRGPGMTPPRSDQPPPPAPPPAQ